MKNMKSKLIPILIVALYALSGCLPEEERHWLYVSFKDPGNEGVWFAVGEDALSWTSLNSDEPWIIPDTLVGVMRDPFIARDPEQGFHMIWTCGRRKIGYAFSQDLVNWSPQKIIPIWPGDTAVLNTWAPEMVYLEESQEWLIFWSTTNSTLFPETYGQVENRKNHRIFCMRTPDFKSFTGPELYYDPGYPVIDASLYPLDDQVVMIIKDERRWPLHKQLRAVKGKSYLGPWEPIGESFTEPWTEGPSVLDLDTGYLVYYDSYQRPQHMGAAFTTDFFNWVDLTDRLSIPERYKHGSFLKLNKAEYLRLIDAKP